MEHCLPTLLEGFKDDDKRFLSPLPCSPHPPGSQCRIIISQMYTYILYAGYIQLYMCVSVCFYTHTHKHTLARHKKVCAENKLNTQHLMTKHTTGKLKLPMRHYMTVFLELE